MPFVCFSVKYQYSVVSKNNSVARKTGLTAPNLLGIMNFILEVLLITVIGKPYSSIGVYKEYLRFNNFGSHVLSFSLAPIGIFNNLSMKLYYNQLVIDATITEGMTLLHGLYFFRIILFCLWNYHGNFLTGFLLGHL